MHQVFDAPLNTTDQSLDRVLKAGLPVALIFVDGSSPLDDTLNRLARQHAGKLLVVKVKAAENPASTQRFGVRRTPAVVAVRAGQAVSQAEAITAGELEQHLNYLLGAGPRPAARPTGASAPGAARAQAPRQEPAGTRNGAGGGQPLVVTEASFEQQVLRSPEPVLVDFWAPWCGSCRVVGPIVDRLAQELPGRLRVAKVNVDDNPGLSMRYGIQGIPAMMMFKNGQVVDQWVGAQPEGAIRQRVMRVLGG